MLDFQKNIDVDVILFFKYLKGLNEEKSVKALSFKLEKHPTTIRRMIKKFEELLNVSLVVYENYQCFLTHKGNNLLKLYDDFGDSITLETLYNYQDQNKIQKNFSIIFNKDFFLPCIINFLEKHSIISNNFFYSNNYENYIQNNNYIIFSLHPLPFYFLMNLYYFKYVNNPNDNLVIHENIYHDLKKIIDFSLINNIIIVNSIWLLEYYINKNYNFIHYHCFCNNIDNNLWHIKPLNFSIKIYHNYKL